MRTHQRPKTRQRPFGPATRFEALRRRQEHQHPGPHLFELSARKPLDGAFRGVHHGDLAPRHLGYHDEMKVAGVGNHVGDARQRNVRKMFAAPFDPLRRKTKTFGGMHDAEHGRAGRAGPGEQANGADRKLQTVVVGDGRQAGGGAVGFVALADFSHREGIDSE